MGIQFCGNISEKAPQQRFEAIRKQQFCGPLTVFALNKKVNSIR